ncbi:x globin isoform X3 [Phyllopteryx taeniolatus]|uniref:x globin isoform X3 n=1 Tax=Phyllopteryx taeniolatus TaxID=161469 RepID=UPI002AD4A806|nr:x globin isoform X3 [Phyllopteryx taeniolatus]
MGCAISGLAESAGLAEKIVRDHDAGGRGGGQHPNQDQIDMIKESWKVIRDDIAKVGIIVFVSVMSFIEKSVARLDQLERLEALAVELGKSHYHYSAPPKYYDYVGAEFISAVQPILKDRWTAELEEAWKTLFQYVTCLMKQGYKEADRQNHAAVSPKERADKRNTAL